MSDADKILTLLKDKPGLKAQEIAYQLGVGRRAVNSLLYSVLSEKVRQDPSYRWYIKDNSVATSPAVPNASEKDQSMAEVRCPQCGNPMKQRIAERGPNAGSPFWGCSKYPSCKATLPFNGPTSTDGAKQNSLNAPSPQLKNSLPRTLLARSWHHAGQVRFVEAVAAPKEVVEEAHYGEIDDSKLREFSQWRIDFPDKKSEISLSQEQRQVIAVTDKILMRGRITLASPRLEKALRSAFGITTHHLESAATLIETAAFTAAENGELPPWLDSDEESIFYREILPLFLGDGYKRFVLPQVYLASLLSPEALPDGTAGQRVDFAIFHPRFESGIIVEIDGQQHQQSQDSDKARDRALQANGYFVSRIPADEVRDRKGPKLEGLKSKLSATRDGYAGRASLSVRGVAKFVQALRIAHQIQAVMLQAIEAGFLDIECIASWSVFADLDRLGLFDRDEGLMVLEESVNDFVELLEHICRLSFREVAPAAMKCSLSSGCTPEVSQSAIGISFAGTLLSDLPTFHVRAIYLPFHLANQSVPPSGFGKPEGFKNENLEYFLHYLFRKSSFWEGQLDGIVRALKGQDALILLPTGAGKSLVYQLASMLLPGRTIVIDPLISLMEDQIYNLSLVGIDRCIAITSQMEDAAEREQALHLLGQGEYLFAFVSPERFQSTDFRDSIRALTVHTPISLIVVDEAHCVSEWGHDFRTAYLNIGRTTRAYCESNRRVPPLLAFTGTASRAVLKDVKRELQIDEFDAIITPKSFDRKELNFLVIVSTSGEKASRQIGYLGQMLPGLFNTTSTTLYQARGEETYSGLIFCPHVNGPYGVVSVSKDIRKLRVPSEIFSGKTPKGWNPKKFSDYKAQVTKDYKRNKVPVLVCTNAFGMGIDKPNIRYTIHYGLPASIESFYQEAGRAGRDRRTAHCAILFSNDDPERTSKLLDLNTSVEQVIEMVSEAHTNRGDDDITRMLFFHTEAFRGIRQERDDVNEVFRCLGDPSSKGDIAVLVPDSIKSRFKSGSSDTGGARQTAEKALHRLLLVGVISDYTIDYSKNEFTVTKSGAGNQQIIETYGRYVAGYVLSMGESEVKKTQKLVERPMEEFVIGVVDLLLHFIYDHIELGRRRALSEMVAACTGSLSDEDIRQRILRYLEATEYSENLEQLVSDKSAGIRTCWDIFDLVHSPNEAAVLRGQVSRYLESYPDYPGLLILRALSEVYSQDGVPEIAMQNLTAAWSSAINKYGIGSSVVLRSATLAVATIVGRDRRLAAELVNELIGAFSEREQLREMVEQLTGGLVFIPAWILLKKLNRDCQSLLLFDNGG